MIELAMETQQRSAAVLVACPDARPPAYQAVIGLGQSGLLDRFVTSSYYDPGGPVSRLARRCAPRLFSRVVPLLRRRYHPEIPPGRVATVPSVDLSLRIEARLAGRAQALKRS